MKSPKFELFGLIENYCFLNQNKKKRTNSTAQRIRCEHGVLRNSHWCLRLESF